MVNDNQVSTVIETRRLAAYGRTLASYIHNFWGFLSDHVIQTAGFPVPALPDFLGIVEQTPAQEQLKMFWDWLESDKVYWFGFNKQWKFHFFPTNERQQFKDDWLPPAEYTQQIAETYALPQFPQQRKRIPDPTDPRGRKRSIRTHFSVTESGAKLITAYPSSGKIRRP